MSRSAPRNHASASALAALALLLAWIPLHAGVLAQADPATPGPAPAPHTAAQPVPTPEPAVFIFENRPIATLRATVLGRTPSQRAAAAARRVDALVKSGSAGAVAAEAAAEGDAGPDE